jgi:hypothetical protein
MEAVPAWNPFQRRSARAHIGYIGYIGVLVFATHT